MNALELSEQEIIRRNSLKEMQALGIDPFPAAEYKVNTSSSEILENFDPEKRTFKKFVLQVEL